MEEIYVATCKVAIVFTVATLIVLGAADILDRITGAKK